MKKQFNNNKDNSSPSYVNEAIVKSSLIVLSKNIQNLINSQLINDRAYFSSHCNVCQTQQKKQYKLFKVAWKNWQDHLK